MERTFYIGYIHGVSGPVPFKETLDAMLFHEILHGYHNLLSPIDEKHLKKREVASRLHRILKNNDRLYENCCDAWCNDEEIHTISGWYLGADKKLHFDWLNTNSYMVLQAIKLGITPVQRVYHYVYELLPEINGVVREDIGEIVISKEKY